MTVYDMNAQEYNKKLSEALKSVEEFKAPEWSFYVKSGTSKSRPIEDPDFWHNRAASILRQVYKREFIGVSRLRTRYGSKKNRGMKPEKFKRSSGKIIRTILQQSDKAGFTQIINAKGVKAGRKLTDKGKKFLEEIK